MSRHRFIRNINVDAELNDDAISDGGEEDMTDEQHDQMADGLRHVRNVLGSEEESGLDDKTIQDSLWDFYFDVEQSIEWLLEEQQKRQAARERRDISGKPLPPLPPHDDESDSPIFHNVAEDQEYYEPTELSGYPDTYRPALSTITEMTERSEHYRGWASLRRNGAPYYTESLSSMTEYPGTDDPVGIPPSPTQSALQRLSIYEAAPSPVTRTSSASPTPPTLNQTMHIEAATTPESAIRQNRQSSSSFAPSVPVKNVSGDPMKSKLSRLASSRASTTSFDSSTSKSSRSFSVDSDSILTYPALRPSRGSRMSLSSEVTASSDGATSTSSHIRRAIQTAMEMEIADQANRPQDFTSESSDASTPRQRTMKLEPSSPQSAQLLVQKSDSQSRAPSKLALLAQAKAQQKPTPWVPKLKSKLPRSQLPETHVHNTRTKYVVPIANGPTATTAITTSYQSLGNLMPSWSAQPPSVPPLSELFPAPTPPQQTTSLKENSGSSKSSESKSPKQSKLAMKVKQSKQHKLVPEAEFIEDLTDSPIQPLFLPLSAQSKAAPSAFASVLIEEVDPGKRKDTIGSSEYNGGLHRSDPPFKDQPVLPTAPAPSHDPVFAFDVPSPDDIVFNARKGTSLGYHGDARGKPAHSTSSRSTNISSTAKPAKEREKAQKAARVRLTQDASSSKSGSPVSTPKKQTKKGGLGSPKYSGTSTPTRGELDQRFLDFSALNLKVEDNVEEVDEDEQLLQVPFAREKLLEDVSKKLHAVGDDEKKGISLVVVGHVDAGKSTLMGRMLYELGRVDEKERVANERASGKIGKSSFSWAWQLDGTLEERERGVTMDIALNSFATPHRLFTILDAPGHRDFIPNMISGASQADCSLLVVDAATGEFEAGFERGGQTREHLLLVRSLGVSQIIVAVNKLDLVNWDKSRYDDICNLLRPFLVQSGFHPSKSSFIPVAAMSGVNLINCDGGEAEILRKWYNGPTLVDLLDKLEPPTRDITSALRFPISNVFKGQGAGVGVTGRVCGGVVQVGERLRILPGDETGVVKSIFIDGESLPWAAAGQNVTMYLTAVDPIHLNVGSVLCPPSDVVPLATVFTARIIVFEIGVPITAGTSIELYHHSRDFPAFVSKLYRTLDRASGKVVKNAPRVLTKGSSAEVQISLRSSSMSGQSARSQPVPLEIFSVNKEMGRILIRRGGETIAAGIVLSIDE